MDEAKVRSRVEAHGDAVVRGDTAAVVADFSEQTNPQIPQIDRPSSPQAGDRGAGAQR